MIDDLVAWLTSALDELERVAIEAAKQGANNVYYSSPEETAEWEASQEGVVTDHGVTLAVGAYGVLDEEVGAHIALHDPRAVLARVEAERAIVHAHTPTKAYGYGDGTRGCPQCDTDEVGYVEAGDDEGCLTLRLLAYGHRYDAEGFRDEWKPSGV